MASLNIMSLLKHLAELRVLLNYNCVDLLAINETRLHGSISDQDLKVEGYDMIRSDRTVNDRFGGGVCFSDQTNTYYAIVSIYRTSKNSPTLQYVIKQLMYYRSNPRRCTTAR